MITTIREMHEATGLGKPWMSLRFRHMQEDYVVNNQSQYDVDKLIMDIERQLRTTNASRNQAQNIASKKMLTVVLNYLIKLKEKK